MKQKILGMMARMMLSCHGATKLISKKQDSKLSMKEKFNLKLHLMTCYLCRRYEKQIELISQKLELYKYIEKDQTNSSHFHFTLSNLKKNEISNKITEEIEK
jgi:hypothetical protein